MQKQGGDKIKRCLAVGLFLLVLIGCEQREEPAIEPSTPKAQEAQSVSRAAGELEGAGKLPYEIDLETGQRVYRQVCATCHAEGIAGAPKMGDREVWQPSLAKGLPVLIEHSINGFQGNRGVMPPKGGAKSLTDQEVASAVGYMVEQNR